MTNREITAAPMSFATYAEPVTWVGPGRRVGEFCIGFEAGRLLFVDPQLRPISDLSRAFGSGEAINGAAFVDEVFALSTCVETIFGVDPVRGSMIYTSEGGAHGMVGSGGGTIIAPMGTDGLRCIQRQDDGSFSEATIRLKDDAPCCYQSAYLGRDESGGDVFASACRSDGIILTTLGPRHATKEMRYLVPHLPSPTPGFDVVGVCSLNDPGHPLGLALLTMDGSVYFAPDPKGATFARMRSPRMSGTPYAIQAAQGHLFLLTSERVIAIRDVVRRILANDPMNEQPRTIHLPTDAVDFAVLDNEYLVVIEAERVTSTSIRTLFRPQSAVDITGTGTGTGIIPGEIPPSFELSADTYSFSDEVLESELCPL